MSKATVLFVKLFIHMSKLMATGKIKRLKKNSQHLKHFTINKNQTEKIPYDDYPAKMEMFNIKSNTRNVYLLI